MKQTPLYAWHGEHDGRMVDFAGWQLPVQYEGILAEHKHCRSSCALFDTSHMGQLLITGPDAAEQLAAAISQDAVKLAVGRGKYGFVLNDQGGVIDDTILFRLAPEEFLLVVNAGTTGADLAALSHRLGGQTVLKHLSDWGKLDVQGPKAYDVLAPHAEGDLATLAYFGVGRMGVMGHEAVLARSGYTGELGYEIFMPGQYLPALADALCDGETCKPAGLGARDSLRLEMGYPLYGHELSTEISPLEAGMDAFLDLDRDYVGVDALREQREQGPARQLVALSTGQRRRFDTGDDILSSAGLVVGVVTSGAFAPSLGEAAGLGYVNSDTAATGQDLTLRTERADIPARIVERPLYTNGTCRMKLSS